MNKVLKILSLLLSYPSQDVRAGQDELKAAVAEETSLLSPGMRKLLDNLIDDICKGDLYEAQERYVHLFDRTRSLSLHLFEHVHGESRDRGQAMVDLLKMYEDNGFEIDAKELPDYLPLFLEFLSTRSPEEIHDLLTQTAHITTAIGERLRKRRSIYSNAFCRAKIGYLRIERSQLRHFDEITETLFLYNLICYGKLIIGCFLGKNGSPRIEGIDILLFKFLRSQILK